VTVTALIAELDRREVQVWVDGDRLQCNAPAGALTPELRDQLRQRKSEILAFLRGPAELSSTQQRLWFLDQVDPGGPAYVIAQAFEIRGPLDAALLERALAALVVRHESLRTVFANVDGRPLQVVSAPQAWTLPVTPVSDEADARERLRDAAARGFDLARGPLFRAHLYRRAPDAHVLLLAMHHIVADGWSMGILTSDLGELFARLGRGDTSPLPAVRLQYRDFARWQRRRLADDALQAAVARQVARLAGAPQLELRTGPRAVAQRRRGATYAFTLPIELADRLRSLARREEVTLFMTLLAGFTVLLSRHSGQEDLLVGTPVANRSRREVEQVVGCFVNTLVLRADLSGDPNVSELLTRVREACLEALSHQDLPLEQLVEELRPERELNRNPLFQVMFTLQNAPPPLELPGLQVRQLDVQREVAQVDLLLQVHDRADGLAAFFSYAADLFDEATIARLAGHWRSLLEAMAVTPARRISELPMLSQRERQQLLVEWNQTAAEYPRDACIHDLFAAQAERTPQAIAVRSGDRQLTYRELEQRSNQLAHHLRGLGVGPDLLVGICVERSLEMVVGLLGILKAGGAYVPIDPAYPAARMTFMLEDAQAAVLLTQAKLSSRTSGHRGTTLCLDELQDALASLPASAPASCTDAANLAYVMYTSGSTGRPKGVCITHRGLVNYVTWAIAAYRVAEGSGAPVHSSIAFDLTVTSLFTPLLSGRTVELLPDDQGAGALAGALRNARDYSLVKLTPAHLQVLQVQLPPSEAARRARTLVIGGEQLQAQAVAFFREHAPDTVLVNEYGPTETVVGCCTYRITQQTRDDGPIPIGRPIANTRVFVLDRHLQPVPIGVAGELYVGGDGVARGYLHRPEATAARFVADPFSPSVSSGVHARLYRTGDLVRWLPDGNLEFLGRCDDQVKLHGFRVEPGEIESTLVRLPQVREATVALREDAPGHPRLVAYVVLRPGHPAGSAELRSALQRQLPDHMVPSAFVMLDRLPLTAHGKVDRRALPAPSTARQSAGEFVPPHTEWELRLARVWQQLLRVDTVGASDDFFDLGGNSLMLVRLISEINRRHQVSLGVAEALLNPTVEQMARLIDGRRQRNKRESAVVQMRDGGSELPVYFIYASPDEFRLAKLMSGRHSVFGIEVPWPQSWHRAVAANRRSGFPTMAQVVAPFVAALTDHARTRPCVIAGHSFGGLLAFEAAHEVLRRGGKVELVILLDTWARPPAAHRVAWHNWRQQWAELDLGSPVRLAHSIAASLWSSWRTTRWLLGQQKARVRSLFHHDPQNRGLPSTVLDEEGMPVPEAIVRRAYIEIARAYDPRPLDCRGVLFRTDADTHQMMRGFDDSNGWSRLFERGLEIVPIVGDHLSMIRQHHPKLAREMDQVLQRHWPLQTTNGEGAHRVVS